MDTEKDIIFLIKKELGDHFKIFEEVRGTFKHWGEEREVVIDLILYPKNETIRKGFPKIFFGVEVKYFNLNSNSTNHERKLKLAYNQCISYKYSKFGKRKIEPAFVLLADNLSMRYKLEDFDKEYVQYFLREREGFRLLCLGQNIGILKRYINDSLSFYFGFSIWDNKSQLFLHEECLRLYPGNKFNRAAKYIMPY